MLSQQDRQAIDRLFQEMYQAWADNNAKRYADCFEEDVDYVAFDGTHIKGRVANERLHATLLNGVLKGTRLEGGLVQLRPLTSDVVLAHATGAVVFPWQTKMKKNRLSIQTLVLVKREGRWLAAAFQNTRVKPIATPEADSFIVRAFSAYAALRRKLTPTP
ncbi:MAG TPA: SgcJ/EcaC family oxidoreductase [Polyangiales bacterium]|nr:SgcJ/EcaC family oxidoreductase [Polyangiales bacterium]